MSNLSCFESRLGKLTCTGEELYDFVTDIRNFKQFIHQDTISDWQAEKESCSFTVSMIGAVNIRLVEKGINSKVVFEGDALQKNDFSLTLNIYDDSINSSIVMVSMNAELNPVLKIMASKPIGQFLERLIVEMENFKGWNNTKEGIRSL